MDNSVDSIKNVTLSTDCAVDSSVVVNDSITIQTQPIEEMLGSVTTYNHLDGSDTFSGTGSKNCQQLRTSARVFKKMKLDSALAILPTADKEKKDAIIDIKVEVKKPLRPQWLTDDKNIFFEALNEFGKDFDAIQQYINNKCKKKGLPDSLIKTKDQVRHFYYRTWHKVSKHLKFSEDIKKIAQELYALINYGELRRKVGSVSEKICMKLNELIYRGTVTIRIKGKTIRIKTPMCRALRKLNQLDEKHEDLKLPTRVMVELRPKNMETWLNVQFMSQNPRIRISLPLQRRFSSVLSFINDRWKTQLTRTHEKVHSTTVTSAESNNTPCSSTNINGVVHSPSLRITPVSNCSVEVPTINLSEYLTSHRICLNAYEERIGVKVPGEKLWQNMCASFKGGGKANAKRGLKRQRNESTGEKTTLKLTDDIDSDNPATSVSEVVDTTINTILSLQHTDQSLEPSQIEEVLLQPIKQESEPPACNNNKSDEITKIKTGWTLENCGTLTIGEMYLMFGNDSKLELEYSWDTDVLKLEQIEEEEPVEEKRPNAASITLKKLLSLAKIHYRKERVSCPCGHICGGNAKNNANNRNKAVNAKTNQRNIVEEKNLALRTTENNNKNTVPQIRNVQPPDLFRKPNNVVYPSNGISSDSFKAQLDSLQRMRPRYTNRRGRPVRSKHVVVERMLPLLPKPVENGHSLVTMKVISPSDDFNKKLKPIAPKIIDDSAAPVTTIHEQQELEPPENDFSMFLQMNDNNVPDENNDGGDEIEMRDVTSPTSISNFLNLEILQNTNDLILTESVNAEKDHLTSFAGLLSDDLPVNTPLSSPSRILKDTDNQWLNSEVNDYSLTSLLGQLESPMKTTQPVNITETPISQDIDVQFPSLLGENGVDFVDQFVDMAAQVDTGHGHT